MAEEVRIDLRLFKENAWYTLLLVILITSLAINMNVSLNEPLVFGDEGYYAARGQYIAGNLKIRVKDTLYGDIPVLTQYMSKPPQTVLSLSFFYMMMGKVGMRAFMPIVSVISASLVFLLGRKLHSTKAGVLAALFYLMMPALITHTIFLYTEQLSMMFLIASFYFLYRYFESERKLHFLISGVLLGFSALTEGASIIFILVHILVLFFYKTNWRSWLREAGAIFAIFFIMISPWMLVHNYIGFGNPGYKISGVLNRVGIETDFTPSKVVDEEKIPQLQTKGLKSPVETGRGTSTALIDYGLVRYIQFAYGFGAFIFSLLGFSYYFINGEKKFLIPTLWLFIFFSVAISLTSSGRVEDASRNTLQVIAPLSIAAGLFGSKVYNYISSFESLGKMLGVIFLVALLGWTFFSASSKASSLRPIKHFSSAFYKGCDWIRENTPEDALIYGLWQHRVEYHCERTPIGNGKPGVGKALIAANNNTYRVFKSYGIDYLYIQKFSIKRGRQSVSYPLKFIQYIEKDSHYKKVYSYPRQCLYRQNIQDCVVVYKFLTDEELGKNQTSQTTLSTLQQLQQGG